MISKKVRKQLETLQKDYHIKDMKKIAKNKTGFIDTDVYQCILNNGSIFNREKIVKGRERKDGSAVIIVPITEDNKTIIVVQPRVFTKSGIGIEVPAGYIDEDETPENAALRELREETGYVPENLIYLTSYYQDQGCSAAFNYCYLATCCKKIYKQKLDRDEYIHYLTCTFEEVLEMLEEHLIEDANSMIAIEQAKKLIKKEVKNNG